MNGQLEHTDALLVVVPAGNSDRDSRIEDAKCDLRRLHRLVEQAASDYQKAVQSEQSALFMFYNLVLEVSER